MIILTALSLPYMRKAPLDLPPIISVELIQITDKTSLPFAPKAKKILEKIKKKGGKSCFRTGTSEACKERKTRCCSFARKKRRE